MDLQQQQQTITFATVQAALAKHFKQMSEHRLFTTDTDGAALWELYLNSFPAGTNQVYKTRTEFDCSCCRHFIKSFGGVVNVVNGRVVTLWDFKVDGPFQRVADALAAYVRGYAISNIYLHYECSVGNANSMQLLEDKSVKTWDHFFVNLPPTAVMGKDLIGAAHGKATATHEVLKNSLRDITLDAVDTVLDLIAQNSLYRGEEHQFAVQEFRKLLVKFTGRNLLVWEWHDSVHGAVAGIRNSVIGSLLIDLSEGKDLEAAVKAYEAKVAPTNYKRPTALVTKAMVAEAQAKVDELGLTTALERRYATIDDITINNLLFADRAVKKAKNVFDEVAAGVVVDEKKLGKVEEVGIADFIQKILPTAQTLEVLLENRHAGNLVSLIAPVDPQAKQLFKWPNGFSWAYTGDLADSIKERVKQAGGSVTGDFRASLGWYNYDDLDLHLVGPDRMHIYYGDRHYRTGWGELDVDMNAYQGTTRSAVENITFSKRERMPEGKYVLHVNQFAQREKKDVGFEVELEFDGVVYQFAYPVEVPQGKNIPVCEFTYSHKDGLVINTGITANTASKVLWGLLTKTFHQVRVVTLSPNQWDGREVGNRHWFFMLDGCRNEGRARGFFNEFLSEALTPHRKVLEVVGAKMQTEEEVRQLSGLGFSSTQRNCLLCRVGGSFSRVVKILF